MSNYYHSWIDEGQSQLVCGAKTIAFIESQGSRAASDKAMENQVNKNNTRHLEVSKSTVGGDKTTINFYDSVTQQYGTGTFKNFSSITFMTILGEIRL